LSHGVYTKFRHNCLSFVRDNTKDILVSFFLDKVYITGVLQVYTVRVHLQVYTVHVYT